MFKDQAMRILRQREGLESNDTSLDEKIQKFPPKYALAEICGWEFGDPRWAETFEEWCNLVGLKIVEDK